MLAGLAGMRLYNVVSNCPGRIAQGRIPAYVYHRGNPFAGRVYSLTHVKWSAKLFIGSIGLLMESEDEFIFC